MTTQTDLPAPSTTTERPKMLGLTAASALVVGSVIGTGVFGLPSALAAFGPISLIAFILVSLGSLALAVVFGRLARRIPGSGGPYLYAKDGFGDFPGFLNAWSYWVTAWAGNAAIVVALVGYVEVFANTGHNVFWSIVIGLIALWIPVVINLAGLRSMGGAQTIFTILKIIPLAFIAVVGLFFIDPHNFGAFNSSGGNAWDALGGASAIALFAFLGIETASVAAGRVKNPAKNISRATVYGTIVCALIYILGTLAVFGTVSNKALRTSTAPFSDAANAIFGGHVAGDIVAIAAVISGLGCLIGWTFIIGEMPHAAAKDNMFPRVFLREKRGVPTFGIVASTVLASLLTITAYTSFTQVFTTVVLLTVFTSVVPYMFSAGAQCYWVLARRRKVHPAIFVKDIIISAAALVFTFWALAGSGAQACFYGVFCLLLGVPLYVWLRVSRDKESQALPSTAPTGADTHLSAAPAAGEADLPPVLAASASTNK